LKLAQRLQIYLLLFGLLSIVLVGIQYWLNRQFSEFTNEIGVVSDINHNISHISYLTAETIEFPAEQRPRQQWFTVYARLNELVSSSRLDKYEKSTEIELIRRSMDDMAKNYNRMIESFRLSKEANVSDRQDRRIWSATNIAAQTIVDQASKLRIRMVTYQDNLYNYVLFMFVGMALLTFASAAIFFHFSNRKIIAAVENLEMGIAQVGEGDFDSKIKLVGDQEMKYLGNQLNHMVEMLHQTTASKEELEAVVAERTQALQASRLAAISVMEDLNIQRKEIEKAREEAVSANRAKSAFLANMSHELRTPLNAILGFSQLMQSNPQFSGKSRANLDIINRSGEHLLQLINDVLDMSKIEAGHIQLESNDFDLGGLINDVVDMMRMRADEKELGVEVDQSSSFPRFVCGDEQKFRQILINLISNAIKFTDKGGIYLRFNGRKLDDDRFELICEVEDSGSGIPEDKIDTVFKPFEQIVESQSDRTRQQGTGLGLSLVKQYVELMGGRVELESVVGEGSIFRFVVSIEKSTKPIEVKATEAHPQIAGLEPGQGEVRILVAEDQAANASLLQQLLELVGFKVKVGADGEEAIGLFKEWKPQFIWMDRRMPVMDGIEATRIIRGLPGGDSVKIVALTASVLRREQEELASLGFDDFIRKPFRANEIFDCLAKHLHLKYRYAEEEMIPVATNGKQEFIGQIETLPSDAREELLKAVTLLDINAVNEVIEKIRASNNEVADFLTTYADSFDFSTLKVMLDNTNGKSSRSGDDLD